MPVLTGTVVGSSIDALVALVVLVLVVTVVPLFLNRVFVGP